MNTVPHFLLGIPIPFKGICTIYHMPIEQRISLDEKYLTSVFLPYVISEEMLQDKLGSMDVFHFIIADEVLLGSFCESLKIFCHAENIRLDRANNKIFIDDNPSPMDSAAFKEFSKIVRDWNCIQKYKQEVEPVFETEAGRQQWLNLKKRRAQSAKVEDDFLGIMINIVQFGGNSFVDEETILKWSYWRLVNAYHAIINSRDYEHSFSAYLQGGKKDLVKQHWTERIKPKREIT